MASFESTRDPSLESIRSLEQDPVVDNDSIHSIPRTSTSTSHASQLPQTAPAEPIDKRLEIALENEKNNKSVSVTQTPTLGALLGWFKVACVISNRMIGTGIFDGPTNIIKLNHSVGATLMLWAACFIASLAGSWMYCEYGLTIPRFLVRETDHNKVFVARSGGELNYLNHIISHPLYLASCTYGWMFILFGNAAANCISFAVHILLAVGKEPRQGEVQGIAIAAGTIVCLIHAFGRKAGIYLNTGFAIIKVAMLCIIIILGFVVLKGTWIPRDANSYANLSLHSSFQHVGSAPRFRDYTVAYLDIIFAFGGWNQANYVLSEVRSPSKMIDLKVIRVKKFKLTSLLTVATIGILYLLVNISYFIVVPIHRATNLDELNIVEKFFELTIGHKYDNDDERSRIARRVANWFMTFSSLGNIIVTTFTAARVKQEIAKEGAIPFISKYVRENVNLLSKFSPGRAAAQSPDSSDDQDTRIPGQSSEEPIPVPALILHCVFTWILIGATWGIKDPRNAYPLLVGVYSYIIDAMTATILGLSLILMRIPKNSEWNRISAVEYKHRWMTFIAATIVVIANGFPIGGLLIPESKTELGGTSIPWEVVPATGWSAFGTGLIYWAIFSYIPPLFHSGQEFNVKRNPIVFFIRGEYMSIAERNDQYWAIPPAPTIDWNTQQDGARVMMGNMNGHAQNVVHD